MCDTGSYYMTLLNIFIKHYNQTNGTHIHMFDGIENITDTNEIMEEFADHTHQFSECDIYSKSLYSPTDVNFDDFEQLFGLRVNDNIVCVCEIMLPILMFIAKEMDWVNADWRIVPLNMK